MNSKKLVIAYWADSELAFVEFARRNCSKFGLTFSFIKISHEPKWFTRQRSILANSLHLFKLFFEVICKGRNGRVVSFGTNTSRILFFFSWLFRDIDFVYNELPSLSNRSLIAWVDKLIFRYAQNVNVSSIERSNFIAHNYNLNRSLGVLENITFTEIPEINSEARDGRILFAGSITSKRFSDDDIDKIEYIFERFGMPIDVYGQVAGMISSRFLRCLRLKGLIEHSCMLKIMQNYEYGLLSYYTGEPNYDLCAPLKIYEYIAQGCKVISLNRNRGLLALAERYPALISFISYNGPDDILFSLDNLNEFNVQRELLLSRAIKSNYQFAERLVV